MHCKPRVAFVAGVAAGFVLIGGCRESRVKAPLLPSAFVARDAGQTTQPTPPPLVAQPSVPAPSGLPAETAPTTQEAAIEPPSDAEHIPLMIAPGQYQTIGGVVSEVNGRPIFANRVLRLLRSELATRALELGPEEFRRFAAAEIRQAIEGLERDELRFAAAERALSDDDRRLAEFLTMQFRTRKITEAGGSIELARRKAAANGDDFEELVYEEYRTIMTRIFYSRKVYPRIQVSADDLRAYYNMNVEREFTQRGEVTFRLIKIDPSYSGGREAARQRAQEVAERAAAADFEAVARMMNHDDRLARSGGLETPIQKGAYRLEEVERVLWETPVGSITPIIEDSGAFYIARVEKRTDNIVRPFEDPAVQAEIRRKLEAQQYAQLSEQIDTELRRNATVRRNEEMTQAALDLAMQGYAIWSRRS